MTRPGTLILERTAPPPRSAPSGVGRLFLVGPTSEGQTFAPLTVRSLDEFIARFGARQTSNYTYDGAEMFFRSGGNELIVVRAAASAASTATLSLLDSGAAASIRVDAIGPGAGGNNISVQLLAGAGAGTFHIRVFRSGVQVEESADLSSNVDAVNWAKRSQYVRVTQVGNNVPAVRSATALAGGTDGTIADADYTAAMAKIPADLGAGQIAVAGNTSVTVQAALQAHARDNNRFALLDLPDSATQGTLTGAVASLTGGSAGRYSMAFTPWIVAPGVTPLVPRTVPPATIVAGMMARVDAQYGPNQPAAGERGISDVADDLSQILTDPVRQALNDAGISAFRTRFGQPRLYGYRTLADPQTQSQYLQANNVRLAMAIKQDIDPVAEHHMFNQIDGQGLELAALKGDVAGVLLPYWRSGALYGKTFPEAAIIDVITVNPPERLATGEVHVAVALRMSPFAEYLVIEITKVPITDSLPA